MARHKTNIPTVGWPMYFRAIAGAIVDGLIPLSARVAGRALDFLLLSSLLTSRKGVFSSFDWARPQHLQSESFS